ncbi:hypothetical protein [Aquitalea aquatilis]|uniref:hypothetical protein n=1 Tax=Aquitalea aquatilis TaxID=1537400 RepID=UPI0010BD2D86|nr:hypothetical protein [Aquitalea aquatilis]
MKQIRGDTFQRHVRLESGRLKSMDVIEVDVSGNCARLKIPNHGLPPVWRVAFIGVSLPGLTARNRPPLPGDFHQVTAIDADWLELSNLSGVGWPEYSGGAVVQFGQPLDISGVLASARFCRPGGAVLAVPAVIVQQDGGLLVTVSADDTRQWLPGPLLFQLVLHWPDGTVRTVQGSSFEVVET